MNSLFGLLFFERDPLSWQSLGGWNLLYWIQTVGGFAAFSVLAWLIFGYPRTRREDIAAISAFQKRLFFTGVALAIPMVAWQGMCVIESLLTAITAGPQTQNAGGSTSLTLIGPLISKGFDQRPLWMQIGLTVGGCGGILAVLSPIIANLFRFRFRRVEAIARLAFKEGVRQRVLYAFSALLLVALFAGWFITAKPSDQIRSYVSIAQSSMMYLLLFTAALLAGLSLPMDMKRQSLQTVVTKPVERFEILLGRVHGFVGLMTMVLVAMAGASLLYVVREINPEASRESLKSRVPVYGDLRFVNLAKISSGNEFKGENVGREWEYRGYLPGTRPTRINPPMAVFAFNDLPSNLGQKESLRAEFTFDIYRTTKGNENQGVAVRFTVIGQGFVNGNEDLWRKERKDRRDLAIAKGQEISVETEQKLDNELAKKYSYFEIPSLPIYDYQTAGISMPGGLLSPLDKPKTDKPLPELMIQVSCLEPTQYIGMARYDLYLRLDDDNAGLNKLWFGLNYLKGTLGLWMQLLLVVTIAVVLSTYFSGVVAFLVTLMVVVMGWSRDFVGSIAVGQNVGGGPLESMLRLVRRDALATQLEDTTANQVAFRSDELYRAGMRVVIDMLPDMERFDFTIYVGEGFDISWGLLGSTFVFLIAYLIPWIILGYYLLRWREVASAN